MATKKKQSPAIESSKTIADQTEAFLKAGGEINKISSGVSGMQSLAGPKHIQLGNKTHGNPPPPPKEAEPSKEAESN